jgi:serine/threonine-protein kinase
MADILDRLEAALADRYQIERELGSGGMATVYLAHDLKHETMSEGESIRREGSAHTSLT